MEWDSDSAFFLRLSETIKRAGGPKSVSQTTGIPVGTLNKYLASTSVPSFTNVRKIAAAGDVSMDWLAGSRAAPARSVPSSKSAALATVAMVQAVGELIDRLHTEAGVKLPAVALQKETSSRMKDLIDRVDDPADIEELMAMLSWLETRIRKDLRKAAAAPGTGKREAS